MKRIIVLIIVILLFTNNLVMANTEQKNEEIGKIYIIGNENLGEIEYYDKETQRYIGLIPNLFNKIEEKTGLDLEYKEIKTDRENEIKNNQADIISVINNTDDTEIVDKIKVFSLPNQQEIYIGFTKVINQTAKETIINCINELSTEEREEIILETFKQEIKEMEEEKKSNISVSIGIVIIVFLGIIIYIKKLQKRYRKEKYTDNITGYSNFQNFEKSYERFITDEVKNSYCIVDIGLDLEYIEEIYGYKEVEKILKNVSKILDENIKDNEMFCRKTNKSFILLLDFVSEQQLEERIIIINEKIAEYEDNYTIKAKFGVYYLNSSDNKLEKAVYYAMQARKICEQNSNLYLICNKNLVSMIDEKNNIEKDIIEALRKQEFISYAQPIFDINNRQIYALEFLARIEDEKLGFIKPKKFLKILERNNIAYDVDMIMFKNACKLLNKWKQENDKIVPIFCNFSRDTLSKEIVLDEIKQVIEEYSIDPQWLGIIITKNILNKNKYNFKKAIRELKSIGLKIILEDFGGSDNSLNDIIELEIDCIKIAPQLLNNVKYEKNKPAIKQIVNFVQNLGIQVICENVKTIEEENSFKDINCNLLQGNFYCYAMPIEEIEKSGMIKN